MATAGRATLFSGGTVAIGLALLVLMPLPFMRSMGVGGLLVPLTSGCSVRDFAVDLGLPLVVVARTGLGTINHTLLTVEAARSAGLTVAGIVMTPWPPDPAPIEQSNRATVERLTGVTVTGLPPATPATLADAGAALPLDDWL
jgi:dethiobiotin synthetase